MLGRDEVPVTHCMVQLTHAGTTNMRAVMWMGSSSGEVTAKNVEETAVKQRDGVEDGRYGDLGKVRSHTEQIWPVGGLTDQGDVMLCQKSLHESCRMVRRIVVMKLICSLGHCECDGHTVHNLS